MDVIETLGVAFGLASLAGINLYLTVLVTGLVLRFELVELAERLQVLSALEHPAVLITSGMLFFVEFFADKIPMVDSLWDGVHTLIRPAGGLLLAAASLGEADPALQIVGALLGGGMAATTHATKATTRMLINTSPEPVSNTVASVTEDAVVLTGLGLIGLSPVLALGMVAALLLAALFLLPKTWRMVKAARARLAQLANRQEPAAHVQD
jgi:hypothetical protein